MRKKGEQKPKNKHEISHGIIKSTRLSKEDQYIAQQEEKLIEAHKKRVLEMKKEEETKRLEEEKQKLKDLHYMKCPKCGMQLYEVSFMDVMVDVCEECMGVWLDHGELETLMLKEASFFSKLKTRIGLKKIEAPKKKKN